MAPVAGHRHPRSSEEAETAAAVAAGQDGEEEPSVEVAFAGQPPPPWWRQVTVRSVAVSTVLGAVLSFMSMRIGLTAGVGPTFNIVASLLGFFVIKSWTRLLARFGVASQPFTRQENVVLQTCIISCSTLSFYGGFTTYLLAMTETVAKSAGGTGTGKDVYTLHTGNVVAFLGLVTFASLFCTLPLRKLMILDYKLMYPSGSAIAGIVNSFHTPAGAATAKRQVLAMSKAVVGSFMWASFQWVYTGGSGCGFQVFPLFGLKAYKQKFYFDFSASLVGVGMICPVLINFSMLFGSIITSFFLWPTLQSKKGDWYNDPSPTNFKGINGYKVSDRIPSELHRGSYLIRCFSLRTSLTMFAASMKQVPMGISMVLGDCLFQLGSITIRAASHFHMNRQQRNPGGTNIPADGNSDKQTALSYDERRRNKIFLNEGLPGYVSVAGYILFAAVSAIFVPRIFPQMRYYHVALLYAVAPILAFCNSYASGLCDWSLASVYAKLAIFLVGAWVGEASGGAIAGLAACGVMLMIIGNAAELMHDFKTGYLTLTSPLSMFISQVIGTALGCLINPLVFLSFEKLVGKEHLGEAGSVFSAPLATAYRGLAILSVEGTKILPKHSIEFCIAFFLMAFCLDCLSAVAKARKWKASNYIPNAMAMAIPFLIAPNIAIDMALGSLLLVIWKKTDKKNANMLAVVVASGLICGDGLWALPSALLSIFQIEPPICMKFFSSHQNKIMREHFLPKVTTSR
ncbi:probable metal-nicotianamine transporter YSL1 isoform X1 [Triticum urartu]|uniref:probable metal-nicotianamine transporter YSL1 isoform X1 n=1 Tax=Triticum urartu TaxID=4572 RepID=UPI002042DDC9|nr:probable metal-nicotianamine transporter YSL1 isoform X1 [Triticum urartu]